MSRALVSCIVLLLTIARCVATTAAQPPDRALFLTDTAYVDLGDPGDAFDLVPGGERTFAIWVRYLQPQFQGTLVRLLTYADIRAS